MNGTWLLVLSADVSDFTKSCFAWSCEPWHWRHSRFSYSFALIGRVIDQSSFFDFSLSKSFPIFLSALSAIWQKVLSCKELWRHSWWHWPGTHTALSAFFSQLASSFLMMWWLIQALDWHGRWNGQPLSTSWSLLSRWDHFVQIIVVVCICQTWLSHWTPQQKNGGFQPWWLKASASSWFMD